MSGSAADERQAHWESIYRDSDPGEVGWYQPKPTISLEWIDELGLADGAGIIDVGGGRSRLVDCLLERGYAELTVLDLSEAALEQSQERLGERADRVTWLAGDVLEAELGGPFEVWHDRAVFHFLNAEADQHQYVRQLDRVLSEEGRVILATFTTEAPERCSGLPVCRREPEQFDGVLGESFELVGKRQETHFTPSGVKQPYVYGLFERR
jgi:cyclopropane fatty-acyl-phospholipid synthase-like methyltransferase